MSKKIRVITASLDLCYHCFMKKQRVGWLFCHDGGLPTCDKCKRKYKRNSKRPIALANYMDAIKAAKAKTKSETEKRRFDELDRRLYPIYLRYEC